MKPIIVRNIDRAEPELINKLGKFGVATVHEAQGRSGLMLPYMRPIYTSARIASSAVTVFCRPGDNMMIHAAIEVCKPGDVLVVTVQSESTDGMFGDLLATSCQANGITGLIIDAGVRDVADLTAMDFPVFSKVISAQGTVKETLGSVNIDVVCGGALVRPGDIIVADLDGVVVVPRQHGADVVAACESRVAKETVIRGLYRAGKLGVDMNGLREKLKSLGVEYVNRTDS
jgi:4-hydroxy-4-methyl-2-oxoglutarate aldolase